MKKSDPYPSKKPTYDIDVVIEGGGWNELEFDIKQLTKKTAAAAIVHSGHNLASRQIELCILLSYDEKLRELNKNYRNNDKPTNVLSFSYTESELGHTNDNKQMPIFDHDGTHSAATPQYKQKKVKDSRYLGDIAISYQRVLEESIENNISFEQHIAHMIMHGVLHLLNYDHENDADAEIMEVKEGEIMRSLGYDDPYKQSQQNPQIK